MKKNSILIALLLVIISFSACNNNKPKKVTLNDFKDSINYTLGQWQGDMFREYYFQNDSSDVQLKAFVKALDEAYSNKGENEMYTLGTHVGKYFQDQISNGHFGDSTLTGDVKLVMRGLINAINEYEEVISEEEADAFYRAFQEASNDRYN